MKQTEPVKQGKARCTICLHPKVAKANSEINRGASLRDVAGQFGLSKSSVHRHVENCLKLEIQALIKEKKIDNAIDHYREIGEQLQFAKELRIAARKYLSDPETGELVLFPRSDEITVIYEDYLDTSPQGNPKKKTDSLDILLERIKDGNVEPKRTIIKHVDIRSFALDSIRTTDTVLDKIFKLEGLYQKDRENSDELAQLKKQIEKVAESQGTDYRTELNIFLLEYADKIKPDLKTQLISELNQ